MPATRSTRRVTHCYTSATTPSDSTSPTTSTSVIHDLPPYRRRQLPDITFTQFGDIIDDDEDYDDMMANIFHRTDLWSKAVTLRHLRFTVKRLMEEARKQGDEAKRIFTEMEGLGLQDELRDGRATPFSRPPTPYPYYPTQADETPAQDNDDLLSYRSPTPPTTLLNQLVPPLGERGNPIIISDDDDDSQPEYLTARSSFSTPSHILLHCQDCVDRLHWYFECPQYICDHCRRRQPMHRVSDCPDR